MTPTLKLRFVERIEPITETTGKRVRILQQWCEMPNSFDMITGRPAGEWRDVPLEQEQT
jgi:hypothetical protein